VTQLLEAYPGKIRLVYRDYPLPNHGDAPKAAEAAHCAGDQGKYWEMHGQLFANQGKLKVEDLKAHARQIGLDGAKFDQCLESGVKATLVAENLKAGNEAGVSGTRPSSSTAGSSPGPSPSRPSSRPWTRSFPGRSRHRWRARRPGP